MATIKAGETQEDLTNLRADLETLREDIQMLMTHMRKASGSAGAEAKQMLSEASERAGETISAAKSVADRKISERPLTAVAIAFGVGLLAGKLMDRRTGA